MTINGPAEIGHPDVFRQREREAYETGFGDATGDHLRAFVRAHREVGDHVGGIADFVHRCRRWFGLAD